MLSNQVCNMEEFVIETFKERNGAVIPIHIFDVHVYKDFNDIEIQELQEALSKFIGEGAIEKDNKFYRLADIGRKLFNIKD